MTQFANFGLTPPTQQSANSIDVGGSRQLTLPWLDYASTAMPESHSLVMWWAQYMWLTDGTYRTAMERVLSHFITDLAFDDISVEEEETWKQVLTAHVDYRSLMMGVGSDYLCYANTISYLYLPFRRSLVCSECGFDTPIEKTEYEISFNESAPHLVWKRKQPCPRCGSTDHFNLRDRRDRDISDVRVIQVPVDELEIAYNRFSDRRDFYWNFAPEDRRDVKSGVRIFIDTTPVEILEAIAVNGKLKINGDMMLHSCNKTISGVKTRGWGIPRSISNFRTAWLQQLVNKQDQAAVIDYTMGMRVISPTPTPGGDDPMVNHGQERFVNRVQQMVNRQRNDPVSYHTSPFPLQYQFLGGEGANLIPFEKLKFRQQEYLSQLNVPLEFHQMNLTVQAAPMMLRMFENAWQEIPALFNNTLNWLVGNLARYFGLKPTTVTMTSTSLAYDMERKHMLMQLMSGQQVSPNTALSPWGIDAKNEVRETIRHQRYVDKVQQEEEENIQKQQELGALRGLTQQVTPGIMLEEQMAQQEQAAAGGGVPAGGGMAGGGMPMGGAPGMGGDTSSLHAMSEQAVEMAQQLVAMPETDRKRALRDLRNTNKDLHSLVTSNMDKIRSEARSQGGQMLIEQGNVPPPPA